ncbi:DSC E3 ubiquitin ligase complex subunit 2 [Madurella mycetomatis]|uniref:DSC E3 ubiquitin ligase complex subunit 2 n=1 Tax=Madurella mycetomatis TaxID=100816 RepID=A0A175VT28_9PEZI|nr:DSC E3 ubiquitin ligase complex subunit 2 [Madurella mycetomatis]
MSFASTPVTRTLVLGLVGSSIAASIFDVKHYFYISIGTHIIQYRQTWRALIYQLCYTNSSEVLFAAMALYNMRVVEQQWGSRKYASFILVSGLLTAIIPPVLLAAVFRPLSLGVFDFLPAGPTPIIFAVLAQYHAMVPHIYKYKVAFSTGPPTDEESPGLTLSDKSTKYLMALQLALFQWPGSLLGAAVGWMVGQAWRSELLPGSVKRWRLPGWIVGLKGRKSNERFEGMRRRLESEGASTGAASGAQQPVGGDSNNRRRTMGQQLLDEVRGAF